MLRTALVTKSTGRPSRRSTRSPAASLPGVRPAFATSKSTSYAKSTRKAAIEKIASTNPLLVVAVNTAYSAINRTSSMTTSSAVEMNRDPNPASTRSRETPSGVAIVNLGRFVDERRARWDELDSLVRRAGRRASSLAPHDVRRLGTLYRATSADLAFGRRAFPGEAVVSRLEDLVVRSRALVYESSRRSST